MINARRLLKLLESIFISEQAEEVSRYDGYGFILVIYTSEHNPPHVHLKSTKGKYICKLYISPFVPEDYNDVIPYKDKITNGLKKKVIKWANDKNKKGNYNWYDIIYKWYSTFKEFNTSEYESIRGIRKSSTVYPSNDTKSVSDLTRVSGH